MQRATTIRLQTNSQPTFWAESLQYAEVIAVLFQTAEFHSCIPQWLGSSAAPPGFAVSRCAFMSRK
jgi:hypothetical protein